MDKKRIEIVGILSIIMFTLLFIIPIGLIFSGNDFSNIMFGIVWLILGAINLMRIMYMTKRKSEKERAYVQMTLIGFIVLSYFVELLFDGKARLIANMANIGLIIVYMFVVISHFNVFKKELDKKYQDRRVELRDAKIKALNSMMKELLEVDKNLLKENRHMTNFIKIARKMLKSDVKSSPKACKKRLQFFLNDFDNTYRNTTGKDIKNLGEN